MKKVGIWVVLLLMVIVFFTGCDRVRASLGKPTSADLVKISDELKAREQFLRDSIAAVRAAEARQDSAVQPADQPVNQPAAQPSAQPAPSAGQPLKRYYAVAGAFKNPEGAQKYVEILQANNLPVHLFDFKSGLKVVCMEGHDKLEDAQRDVATLKELKLADSDPWIYNTNQKLHK
jgi:hypothetical protein